MHFLAGLFFLLLVMLLTFFYISATYFFVLVVTRLGSHLWRKIRRKRYELPIAPITWGELLKPRLSRKALLFFLVALVTYHLFFYTSQRAKWMGNENAHLDAKQYWIAGQVLLGFRLTLSRFLHPESIIAWPSKALQEEVYRRGVELLPSQDGERGVWTDLWLVQPYSKYGHLTKDASTGKPSPDMIKLLETAWDSIETVATKPIADKRMREQEYMKNFPAMVLYYASLEGFLTGIATNSAKRMAKDEKHIQRSKNLVFWLESLMTKWVENENIKNFVRSHPEIISFWEVSMLKELDDVIRVKLLDGSLDCSDPYVEKYAEIRSYFVDGSNGPPTRSRMKDVQQAQYIYNSIINSFSGRLTKYALEKYCGLSIAGGDAFFHPKSKREKTDYEFYMKGIQKELLTLRIKRGE
jgi:hypothetical protein